MKQLIRQNTFETNSSSMHSLCIMKEGTDELLENLNYRIGFDEYGWGTDVYTTSIDIITYLWTMLHCGSVGNKYIDIMKEWLPNCTFEEPEIKKSEYGNKELYYDFDGYIDHGGEWWHSYDYNPQTNQIEGNQTTCVDEIFKDKETFKNLIFNGRLCVCNDNSNFPWNDNETEDFEYSKDFVPREAIKYFIKGN